MSKREYEGEISDTQNKRFKKELSVDEAKTEIANEIIEQIKKVLENPVKKKDLNNSLGDTMKEIF